ncbi:MAG: chemotaxis protein CheC [Coxiellaceae bacterium]|nr:chemotaxis protein CheC [Coxiellaceae bacterium]
MRPLTAMERDALSEVCNIGVSQAAKQLSLLLNDEVVITVPEVQLADINKLPEVLGLENDEKISCVRQMLSGELSGSALLLFHNDESRALVASLVGSIQTLAGVDTSKFEYEAVTEIGNIIISACLCAMSNFLNQDISFTVPTFFESDAGRLCSGISNTNGKEYKTIIVINTEMRAYKRDVGGTLLITFTVPSMDYVTDKLAQLLGGVSDGDAQRVN